MAVSSAAPSGESIQELLDKADRLIQRIRGKLQEIVDKINGLLSSIPSMLVPDGVVEAIQAGIEKMYQAFSRLVSEMQRYFDSPGWPPALFDAGERWLSDVAGPAAETEDQVNATSMKVDDYWKGTAADSYKKSLGSQQPAFGAMVDVARKIKECLHVAGWAIIKFWVAVGIGCVTAVAGVIAAVVAIAGIVSAPAAPFVAAGAILSLVAAVAAGAWAAFVEFQAAKDQASALREEARFNTAFEGNQWPRATAEGEWQAD